MNNGHRKPFHRLAREVWWCCAVDKVSLRPIIQGWHSTDTEARRWGFENMGTLDFEVLPFPTTDKQKARDYYKNLLAERSKDISVVFKRAIYPKEENKSEKPC